MQVSRPCGILPSRYAAEQAITSTRVQQLAVILGLVFLFTLPVYLSGEFLGLANLIGISIIVALGIHILTGLCGIINFGQAGFVCVGAYTTTILCSELGWNFWGALICATLISGIVGLLFGLVSIRVKGFYLIVVTLAAGIIIPLFFQVAILPWRGISVAGMAGVHPTIGGNVLHDPSEIFFIIMPIMVICTFLAIRLTRGRIGRALRSVRDNELSAQVGGVDIFWYRIIGFFLCCLFAGLGGSLWCIYMPSLSLGQFSYAESIWYLGMIIVGGMGTIGGVFMGAVVIRGIYFLITSKMIPFFTGLIYQRAALVIAGLEIFEKLPPELIGHLVGVTPLVLSILIILFLVLARQGIMGWWDRFKNWYRWWPVAFK